MFIRADIRPTFPMVKWHCICPYFNIVFPLKCFVSFSEANRVSIAKCASLLKYITKHSHPGTFQVISMSNQQKMFCESLVKTHLCKIDLLYVVPPPHTPTPISGQSPIPKIPCKIRVIFQRLRMLLTFRNYTLLNNRSLCCLNLYTTRF